MGIVSMREFNSNVSKFVALAEAGEIIKVARNGKVVAEIHPPSCDRRETPEWQKAYSDLLDVFDRGIPVGRTFSHDERNG
jgi:antitoxin (DNA-binding transcriptional repressor) of toxin-antitoxin stability system